MANPDFYVGEYGDPIVVTLPFDPNDFDEIVIEVQKPGPGWEETTWADDFTLTTSSVSRNVKPGELDVGGIYRCAVVCTAASPELSRRVRFDLRVDDATPRR